MKTKITYFVSFLAVILFFLVAFSSCIHESPKPKSKVISFEYFNTVTTFYDYSGLNSEEFTNVTSLVKEKLSEYHRLYDIYNEYEGITNLASLNKNAGSGALTVDKKIIDMLLFSEEMYKLTSGNVNVAMGAVLEIWHNYRSVGESLPSMEMLKEASLHTKIEDLIIDEEKRTVELRDSKMSLDVGAIGKGYAVEMIAAELEAMGYSSFVIDVGGNLRSIGEKPDGSGWKTGVKNPSGSGYSYTMEMKNSAVVTSGSYERFYTVDGVNYHHIINPETLMPENYYLSVTVKSDNSAFSDSLSTAIFNMKPEEAESFISSISGVFVIFVMPDGGVITMGDV
jgi:thiamine biosynthesis lipoprotein